MAQLTLQDLSTMQQIIDTASSRGAFRGAELATTGALYEKITEFLEEVQKQQEEQQAPAETGSPQAPPAPQTPASEPEKKTKK